MSNERVEDGTASAETIPLVEEQAAVEVRRQTTGRVRLTASVETFEQIAHAELGSEDVEMVRVPIGQPVSGELPQVRTEGETTIVPIFEEVLFVERRLVLKEEIHLRKHRTTETVDVPVTLRRQVADVERVTADGSNETSQGLDSTDRPG